MSRKRNQATKLLADHYPPAQRDIIFHGLDAIDRREAKEFIERFTYLLDLLKEDGGQLVSQSTTLDVATIKKELRKCQSELAEKLLSALGSGDGNSGDRKFFDDLAKVVRTYYTNIDKRREWLHTVLSLHGGKDYWYSKPPRKINLGIEELRAKAGEAFPPDGWFPDDAELYRMVKELGCKLRPSKPGPRHK